MYIYSKKVIPIVIIK